MKVDSQMISSYTSVGVYHFGRRLLRRELFAAAGY